MAVAAIALAGLVVSFDGAAADGNLFVPRFAYAGSPEGATAVLGTIAGSMITIAGVVFSMTLVALSLASSQFGPRLLRNFMRDNTNQVVLGTFVATFLYCVLVLRAIQYGGDSTFVPHVAINLAVLLALVSIGVLIYFIHHISLSIQADEIIARVAAELDQGIELLFPEQIGHDAGENDDAKDMPGKFDDGVTIESPRDGYLQIIDAESLIALAQECDSVFRLLVRPGDYIVAGGPLVSAPSDTRLTKAQLRRIQSVFVVGDQRSTAQDVEFCVQQLVEIAVRALSPGINDPFTAMSSIDRLGSAYCRVANRRPPGAERTDAEGVVRVVAPVVTFARMVEPALSMIRQSARANVSVTLRLLDAITAAGRCVRRTADGDVLRRHAALVREAALDALTTERDREAVERRYDGAIEVLGEGSRA